MTDLRGPLRQVGDYEILGELGRGGMGIVYRARQTTLDREVAVKMVRGFDFADTAALQRFREEARAVAQLQHPNIVAIHEVGEHEGLPYFSMELVQGQTLLTLIREGALTIRDAVRLLRTVAQAIHYAHEQGVLHRDLKPSNILLDAFGEPCVTDFGLAKRLNTPGELTRSGQTLGSPGYIPPEQISARRGVIGPPSDVYALGAILYHALTGRPPFVADTAHDALQTVLEIEPASPRQLNPALPRDLETICLKCLAKEPSRRYATAAELAEELQRWLAGEPIHARPTGWAERAWRWCRRHPAQATLLGVTVLSGVAAALGGWWHVRSMTLANRAITAGYQRLVQLRLDSAERLLASGRASESVATLARAVRESDTNQTLVTRLQLSLAHGEFAVPFRPSLVVTAGVEELAVGWGGRRIAARSLDGYVRVWDTISGALVGTPVKFHRNLGHFATSADGRRVAVGHKVSEETALLNVTGEAGVWDMETGRLLHRLPHTGQVNDLSFSADGHWLATAGGDGLPRIWDTESGETAVTLGVRRQGLDAYYRVSLSADGELLAGAGINGKITLWSRKNPSREIRSWPSSGKHHFLRLIGDRLLIFEGYSGQSGLPGDRARVCAVSTDTGQGIWTNEYPAIISFMDLSRDGTWLSLLLADGSGHVVDTTTGRQQGKSYRQPSTAFRARLSPTGDRVATAGQDGMVRIWGVASGELAVAPLAHDWFTYDAVFSPDGQWFATACMDGQIRFWTSASTAHSVVPLESGPHLHAQMFDATGRRLLVSGTNSVSVFAVPSGELVTRPLKLDATLRRVALDPKQESVLAIGSDGMLREWSLATGQESAPPFPTTAGVSTAAFSRDGARLATIADGYVVRTWDVLQRVPWCPQPMTWEPTVRPRGAVYQLAFSPDGASLALAGHWNQVLVWDAATGNRRGPPLSHRAPLTRVAFSPDGRTLATACMDFRVRIWDVASGVQRQPELPHRATPMSVEFSPDGSKIATAGQDKAAWIWDAATLRLLAGPMAHDKFVDTATFSPDGVRVATGGWDGTARVWDAATGLPLTGALRLDGRLARVVFSPDGNFLAGASMSGPARLWSIGTPVGPTPDWLAPLAEGVAGQRLLLEGRFDPVKPEEFFALRDRLRREGTRDAWHQWAEKLLGER